LVNLKARLSALALVGVARGIGLAVGDGEDKVGVGEEVVVAEDCAVGLEPIQPVITNAPTRIRANLRMLSSLLRVAV
jgi:hypothetical protein